MGTDVMGDRMKLYEGLNEKKLIPSLPILVRIDGKNFSTFTRGLGRPYDEGLTELMKETTRYLVEQTNACIGYTQSDEITLVLWGKTPKSEVYFNGKHSKLVSVLASMATAFFAKNQLNYLPLSHAHRLVHFDCRVWNVPSLEEAANAVLWREIDATKNSVQMLAQEHFSHKELQGKGRAAQHDLLHTKGINWNDYPSFFKRGSYFARADLLTKYSVEDIEELPPKHHLRRNPGLVIERRIVVELDMPPFMKVINRTGVIFFEEDPIVESNSDSAGTDREAAESTKQEPQSVPA